ncbi:MAG: hypothetical protein ACE5MH_03060 [Terriglobia bacterium]
MAKVRKWARRRIVVNAGYQFRTLLPILFYTVVFVVLVGALVFFPLHRELNDEPDPEIQVLLQEQLFGLHVRLWPMLLFAAFLASVYALLRSHHVAGPLYRLRHVLQRMTEGDYRGVRFRQGDEFREFEAIASQLGKKMQMLSTRNRDVLLSVESRVKQLVLRLDKEELPKVDVQTALDAILAQLDKARERVPLTR